MTKDKMIFNLGEAAAMLNWWLDFNYLTRKRDGLLTDDSTMIEPPESVTIRTLKVWIETLEAARRSIYEESQIKTQFKVQSTEDIIR